MFGFPTEDFSEGFAVADPDSKHIEVIQGSADDLIAVIKRELEDDSQ